MFSTTLDFIFNVRTASLTLGLEEMLHIACCTKRHPQKKAYEYKKYIFDLDCSGLWQCLHRKQEAQTGTEFVF